MFRCSQVKQLDHSRNDSPKVDTIAFNEILHCRTCCEAKHLADVPAFPTCVGTDRLLPLGLSLFYRVPCVREDEPMAN